MSLARTSVVQPHLCKEIMKFSLLPPSLKDWSDPHLPLLIFSSSTPTATNEKYKNYNFFVHLRYTRGVTITCVSMRSTLEYPDRC